MHIKTYNSELWGQKKQQAYALQDHVTTTVSNLHAWQL